MRMEPYRQGLTDKEIAEIEGVSRQSVANWRTYNKLPRNTRNYKDALPKDKHGEMLRFLVALHHYKPNDVKGFIDLYREGII